MNIDKSQPYLQAKHIIKRLRWQARRARAALSWGPTNLRNAPIVLGNAMPKSGSHLIIQILQGLTKLGPFVNPGFPPVNRFEDNSHLPEARILDNIQHMRSGDISYGYLHAREPFISALTGPRNATIFVYRDPRDMIVSQIFYATEIHKGHGMHHYYTKKLSTMEARITAAIEGVEEPGSEMPGVQSRYESYLGWLNQPGVLCLRFEELILDRESTLGKFLDYLEMQNFTPSVPRLQAIQTLQKAVNPNKSGTFRKGQPGNWREHFTDANKVRFKEFAGELLVRLGYEVNSNW